MCDIESALFTNFSFIFVHVDFFIKHWRQRKIINLLDRTIYTIPAVEVSSQFYQWRCPHNFISWGIYPISAVEVQSTQFHQWRCLRNFSSGGFYTISAVSRCLHNFSSGSVYTISAVEVYIQFQQCRGAFPISAVEVYTKFQ